MFGSVICDIVAILFQPPCVNTLRPRQNGRHFPDDNFNSIFLNEKVWTLIKISLKFVPKGPIDNIPALVQIMAWRRLGDKSLSEPMIVRLPTHICITRPQWVKQRIPQPGPGQMVVCHWEIRHEIYVSSLNWWGRPGIKLVGEGWDYQ